MARSYLPVLTVASGDSCEAILGVLFSLFSVNSLPVFPDLTPVLFSCHRVCRRLRGAGWFALDVDIIYLLLLCIQWKTDSLHLPANLVPYVLDLCQENSREVSLVI